MAAPRIRRDLSRVRLFILIVHDSLKTSAKVVQSMDNTKKHYIFLMLSNELDICSRSARQRMVDEHATKQHVIDLQMFLLPNDC